MHGAVELAGTQRVDWLLAGKQPATLEQLALLDAQGHAGTVDITDLESHHLTGTQAGTIGHRQRGLVLQMAGRRDQAGNLIPAQDHRQFAWHGNLLIRAIKSARSSVTSKKNRSPVMVAFNDTGEMP